MELQADAVRVIRMNFTRRLEVLKLLPLLVQKKL